ncbi:CRISPR-associated ring nuclease Csm6 [Vibrio rarus]|uniref:CRISPR-associated ring nuclease Csm6 n=1 Tax=Vibrio rarus TaxID=413403 RepID=UPI0021C31D47|nr:CRISPR-associated ring nuclease Csm6 [Vibrio rarus]
MKNILLSTTGASPQVLTETLYSIAHSGRPFPDEIYVITTQSTKDTLLNGLFRDGHLAKLLQEYHLPTPKFDAEHILLIEDHDGNAIKDAKTVEDQTYMADFITKTVREFTCEANTAIHASLAGGRKTMAFYFGYAMSLYGRQQDTLSHVFVDDNFEFVRDFWFPTKESHWVTGKNGQGEVDISQASVTLAEIPFVRMRSSLDPSIIESMANLSFSQTVGMLNASHKQEDVQVTINSSAKLISTLGVDIKLTAKEIAFYLWLYHKGENGLLVDRYFEEDKQNSIEFLKHYSKIAKDPRVFESFDTTPEEFNDESYDSIRGMEKSFLQPICSNINRKLRKALPAQSAEKIEISSLSKEHVQRYTCKLACSAFKVII